MSRPEDATTASLRARALAAVADLDPGTLVTARWTGLVGLRTTGTAPLGEPDTMPGVGQSVISLIDAFEVPGGGAIAIIGVAGIEPGRVDGRSEGETIRLTVPLDGPAPWIGLHELASRGGSVPGLLGGRLTGRPGRGSPPGGWRADGRGASSASALGGSLEPGLAWRAAPGDQSHTSVVIEERFMLKLYRRLAPGPNPEGELLAALDGVGGAPVPDWVGSVEFERPAAATGTSPAGPGRAQPTTVAIDQGFIAGSDDAFEVLADQLATWLASGGPPPTTELIGATGRATAELHLRMARIAVSQTPVSPTPTEARHSPTHDDRRRWLESAERTLDDAKAALGPVDADLATQLAHADPAIRRALRPIGDPALPVAIQRIHGDLHLGQVLNAPSGVLIVDFEGDPTRDARSRREPASALRDVAGFLRSIDHVARSGRRRAIALGAEAIDPDLDAAVDAWIEGARGAFLAGYRIGLDDPAWQPNRALLRAFEVEKELGEFIYASRYLPTWLYAPRSGMNALLGRVL